MTHVIEREVIETTTVEPTQAWEVELTVPETTTTYSPKQARDLAAALIEEAAAVEETRERHIASLREGTDPLGGLA